MHVCTHMSVCGQDPVPIDERVHMRHCTAAQACSLGHAGRTTVPHDAPMEHGVLLLQHTNLEHCLIVGSRMLYQLVELSECCRYAFAIAAGC